MTSEEIDKLEAGRELDALVAEKVMEWPEWKGDGDYEGEYPMFRLWDEVTVYSNPSDSRWFCPSTSISAAWDVLEKLCQNDKFICLTRGSWKQESNNWTTWLVEVDGEKATERIEALTAPLAICRAALKAKLKGDPDGTQGKEALQDRQGRA